MSVEHQLKVDLGDRSYPIYIGKDLLGDGNLISPHVRGQSALIVSNTTVAPLYLGRIKESLEQNDVRVDQLILQDGEQYKTLAAVESIIDLLLTNRHDRHSTVIALGGGVIGDIAGFAASIYQRGINFIQIPTTLLSQVDSSVGGKTGVNHPLGKNMIGAFYQPQCVIIDINSLSSLPDRELSTGMAEVIKYGLIHDAKFFEWLENNIDQLLSRDPNLLAAAILTSCQIKAQVVELDEHETGLRAILNLGHTFGHAIETTMGYGNWLHGEAVAAGTMMAIDLSIRQGWLDQQTRTRSLALFSHVGLPVAPPPTMTRTQFLETMAIDKKTIDGKITLILLQSLGKAIVSQDYSQQNLMLTLPSAI